MARRGGYSKSEPVEWVKVSQITYGEAITSAAMMGQTLDVWMSDAVQHHLYRCDVLKAQERYQMDEAAAAAALQNSPDKNNPRYQVDRPKPTITKPAAPNQSGSTRGPQARP